MNILLALVLSFSLSGCNAGTNSSQGTLKSANAETRKHAELLLEMYLDLFGGEPRNQAEFASLVDSMNQGASLEGVYNGLLHSREFRELESSAGLARPETIKVFVQEYDVLQSALPARKPLGELDHASVYRIKSILSDAAFQVILAKQENKKELASWYSRWVVHMASLKVNFGIKLRSEPNEKFHYQWAMNATQDQLQWEVLNRLHRVINDKESGNKK